jgi:hypothetical protein
MAITNRRPALLALLFVTTSVSLVVSSGCGRKEEPAAGKGSYYTGPMKPKGTPGAGGATKGGPAGAAPRAE